MPHLKIGLSIFYSVSILNVDKSHSNNEVFLGNSVSLNLGYLQLEAALLFYIWLRKEGEAAKWIKVQYFLIILILRSILISEKLKVHILAWMKYNKPLLYWKKAHRIFTIWHSREGKSG